MQLPFIVIYKDGDETDDRIIWADDVDVTPEGLIFIEYLECGVSIQKAAFKNWVCYYVDDDAREEQRPQEED